MRVSFLFFYVNHRLREVQDPSSIGSFRPLHYASANLQILFVHSALNPSALNNALLPTDIILFYRLLHTHAAPRAVFFFREAHNRTVVICFHLGRKKTLLIIFLSLIGRDSRIQGFSYSCTWASQLVQNQILMKKM